MSLLPGDEFRIDLIVERNVSKTGSTNKMSSMTLNRKEVHEIGMFLKIYTMYRQWYQIEKPFGKTLWKTLKESLKLLSGLSWWKMSQIALCIGIESQDSSLCWTHPEWPYFLQWCLIFKGIIIVHLYLSLTVFLTIHTSLQLQIIFYSNGYILIGDYLCIFFAILEHKYLYGFLPAEYPLSERANKNRPLDRWRLQPQGLGAGQNS